MIRWTIIVFPKNTWINMDPEPVCLYTGLAESRFSLAIMAICIENKIPKIDYAIQ